MAKKPTGYIHISGPTQVRQFSNDAREPISLHEAATLSQQSVTLKLPSGAQVTPPKR